MKFNVKTSSKNLGKLMRSGGTAAAHPDQTSKTADDIAREAEVEEELARLDTDSFERILRNVADSKTDLLKNIPSGVDPALVSIMGLIDDNKERLAAEKEHNNTSSKAPVKFDEVVDFIDDGAEEIDVDKMLEPVTFVRKVKVTPVCGNPTIDMDALNGNGHHREADEKNKRKSGDLLSKMEMGYYSANIVNSQMESITNAVDDVDMEKVRKCQINDVCDENEQKADLLARGIEAGTYNNVLGPTSGGRFISFHNAKEIIGTDLGASNPVSVPNANFFQTLTPNGRLLPAVPRKYFGPDYPPQPSGRHPRPAPIKSPVTIMLQSTGSPLQANNEAYIQQLGSPVPSLSPPKSPPQPPPQDNQIMSASTKKRMKRKERAAKKAAAALIVEESEQAAEEAKKDEEKKEDSPQTETVAPAPVEMNSSVEDEDKEEKEEEKENELTEEEREARRLRNRKDRMKKKAKKQEEKKSDMKAIDTVANQLGKEQGAQRKDGSSPMGGSTSSLPEESPKAKTARGANGGKKKQEKGVVDEYRVPLNVLLPITADELSWLVQLYLTDIEDACNYARSKNVIGENDGKEKLTEALKELGIDNLDDLVESRKKKNKANRGKGNTNNNNGNNDNKNSNKQQSPTPQKETAEEKKMDESSIAASITKKNSEEDDNQSYVSAQENVEADTRTSTPEEFLDARQSRDDTDNVMLDPKNYADDRGIEALAQQLADEDAEFVTVSNKKGKKNKKAETPSNYAAVAAGSQNRRASTAASSVSTNHGQGAQSNTQRNANRPMPHSSTLGDFMDSTPKKDSHKNTKKKGASGGSGGQKKPVQQVHHDELPPPSPAFEDALDQPISLNTNNPPCGGVSYADAAKHKKSSSGDSSPLPAAYDTPPQGTNSPVPSTSTKKESPVPVAVPAAEKSKTPSPIPETMPTTSQPSAPSFASAVSGGVQLPPSAVATADDDISFGYEETPEEKRKQQRKKSKNSPQPVSSSSPSAGGPSTSRQAPPPQPQRINAGDLLRQLGNQKMVAMPTTSTSEETIAMKQALAQLWDKYQNTGTKPLRYVPGKPLI